MRILLAALLVTLLYAVFEHVAEGSARFIVVLAVLFGVLVGFSLSAPRETKYVYLKPEKKASQPSVEEQLVAAGFDPQMYLHFVRNNHPRLRHVSPDDERMTGSL